MQEIKINRVGLSERGKDYLDFALEVLDHIENYTVPQYGDKGQDQVTNWTADECAKAVKKYLDRRGRNRREGQEHLDMLKSAHYVQLTDLKDVEQREIEIAFDPGPELGAKLVAYMMSIGTTELEVPLMGRTIKIIYDPK